MTDISRAKTSRSKSSFLFTEREIKRDNKTTKNMDVYSKKVCDFKIKVKIEKNEEGIKKVKDNLSYFKTSNEYLSKIQNVFN